MDLKIFSPKDFPAYLPKLNLLYDELFSGGKGFRAKLVQTMGLGLSIPIEVTRLLCQTIEFIHNASLLHDDLVDKAPLRRGKTSAWLRFTPEYAVLAGDYLLARVMVNLSLHGNIKLVQFTAEMISDLLEGEWLQDSIVGDFFVRGEQLDRIHLLKTASLFRWCFRAPCIALNLSNSRLEASLDEMGHLLGLLFQRSDDLLDYDVRNNEGKAVLGDLKSGYLNSFGAFLCHGRIEKLDRKAIDNFVKAQSLSELHGALGGQKNFDLALSEFDGLNTKLIQMYHHHVVASKESLVEMNVLNDGEESARLWAAAMDSLPDLLYWRKKPTHLSKSEREESF